MKKEKKINIGVGVGVTVFLAALVKVCNEIILRKIGEDGEFKKCSRLSGDDKIKCQLIIKIKAYNEGIKRAKMGLNDCSKTKDPTRCKERINVVINKYREKIDNCEKALKELK